MEQILLSPDVAVKQTTKVRSVTTDTAESNEESFDPILEEAVGNQTDIKNSQQETASSTEVEPEKDTEQLISSDDLDLAQQTQTANQLLAVLEGSQNNLPKASGALDLLPLSTPIQNSTATLSPASVLETNSESYPYSTNFQQGEADKAETIFLKQIQQIIDEEKNIGTITIKSSNISTTNGTEQSKNLQGLSSIILNDTEQETIQVRQTNNLQMFPEEQKTSSPNNATANSVNNRQEITEQFFNAKFGESKNDGEQQAASQNFKQKGSGSQQKSNDMSATLPPTSMVNEPDVSEAGFTQQLHTAEVSTNASNTSIEGKFAPGAHQPAVPERELVDNLIQRFNVNPRLQTSKLTLQLHPAELGQLKIDILVKGDSVSANIVAHSQQVVETMERNIHRLRAVLENQGFTVDSFQVTMDDNGGKQSELFQEQFNSNQQEFTFTKPSENPEAFDALLDLQNDNFDINTDDPGVNVTI